MKRILLLIVFFGGLIPNLKEMCFESAYSAKGQSYFDEYINGPYLHCGICNETDLVEVEKNGKYIYYCPCCHFYCGKCHAAFPMHSDDDVIEHKAIHKDDNENGNEDSNNNDDNGEPEIVTYYICIICNNSRFLTEEEKNRHINLYDHQIYKKVQILQ